MDYGPLDLIVRKIGFLSEPGIRLYLFKSYSVATLKGEEFYYELFEFGRETVADFTPIGVEVTFKDQVVEVVFFFGLAEWIHSLDHYEENYSNREDIDFFTLVHKTLFYLGSHICLGTAVGLKSVDAIVGGESKVSKL